MEPDFGSVKDACEPRPPHNAWGVHIARLICARPIEFTIIFWLLVAIGIGSIARANASEAEYERAVAYCYAGHAAHFNGAAKSKATEGARRHAICVCRIAAERRMGSEQIETLRDCEDAK